MSVFNFGSGNEILQPIFGNLYLKLFLNAADLYTYSPMIQLRMYLHKKKTDCRPVDCV